MQRRSRHLNYKFRKHTLFLTITSRRISETESYAVVLRVGFLPKEATDNSCFYRIQLSLPVDKQERADQYFLLSTLWGWWGFEISANSSFRKPQCSSDLDNGHSSILHAIGLCSFPRCS